jgi:hypothetical protein
VVSWKSWRNARHSARKNPTRWPGLTWLEAMTEFYRKGGFDRKAQRERDHTG